MTRICFFLLIYCHLSYYIPRVHASESALRVHSRLHSNNGNYTCHECNKMFQGIRELRRHEMTHRNPNYQCRYCQKLFKTQQYCRSHMITHLKQLMRTDQPNETESIQTLVQNNPQSEIIIQDIKIPKKLKKNTKKPKEIEMMITNEENIKLRYSCLKCSKKFRYNAWLKKHVKERHAADGNSISYPCNICHKEFTTNQTLKNHLLSHRKDIEPKPATCQCLVCGKLYSNKKTLNVHLRIHTEDRPFKCEIDSCGKSFRTSGHLIQHQKASHKNKI